MPHKFQSWALKRHTMIVEVQMVHQNNTPPYPSHADVSIGTPTGDFITAANPPKPAHASGLTQGSLEGLEGDVDDDDDENTEFNLKTIIQPNDRKYLRDTHNADADLERRKEKT